MQQSEEFVIDDLHKFQNAIASAKFNSTDFVEVEQKVFDYFTKGKPTQYFWHQDVRVYVKGTKDKIDAHEARVIL